MPDEKLFHSISSNITKCEVRLDQYRLPPLREDKTSYQNVADFDSSNVPMQHEPTSVSEINSKSSGLLLKTPSRWNINVSATASASGKNEIEDESIDERKLTHSQRLALAESRRKKAELEEDLALESAILKDSQDRERVINKYVAFAENLASEQPKLCMWLFMTKDELENLLICDNNAAIQKMIDQQLRQEYPRGIGRILIIKLLQSVIRFCQKMQYSSAQSGTLLTLFYLTHQHFLRSLHRTPREVYNFFKDFMLTHSINCPPDCMQLFDYQQSTEAVVYFCKMYVRNIPLIRMLTLPNFGLILDYEKKEDPFDELLKMRDKNKAKKK